MRDDDIRDFFADKVNTARDEIADLKTGHQIIDIDFANIGNYTIEIERRTGSEFLTNRLFKIDKVNSETISFTPYSLGISPERSTVNPKSIPWG